MQCLEHFQVGLFDFTHMGRALYVLCVGWS